MKIDHGTEFTAQKNSFCELGPHPIFEGDRAGRVNGQSICLDCLKEYRSQIEKATPRQQELKFSCPRYRIVTNNIGQADPVFCHKEINHPGKCALPYTIESSEWKQGGPGTD